MKKFRNTDALLQWAYAIAEEQICKISDAQRAMAGASGTNKSADGDLSRHDQHAQAAMVRSYIERLDPVLVAYAWAAYSWNPDERRAGNQTLGDHLAVASGVHNGHLRFLLMRRHIELGQDRCMSCERIAEKIGAHKRTVQRHEPRVRAAMDAISARFFEAIDLHFAASGLIR